MQAQALYFMKRPADFFQHSGGCFPEIILLELAPDFVVIQSSHDYSHIQRYFEGDKKQSGCLRISVNGQSLIF